MDLFEYQAKELFAKHNVPTTPGRVTESGTFDELVRLGGTFADLAKTQFMAASVTQ